MTREELQSIFESEFNWDNWKQVMNFVFPEFKFNIAKNNLPLTTKSQEESLHSIVPHGQGQLARDENLLLFEVLVKDNIRLDRNVKSVRRFVASDSIPNFQAIIAVFHSANKAKWRFTLVVREFSSDGKVVDKKPESYTYVFGKGEKGRTAAERFFKLKEIPNKSLSDLEKAFSVKALSDEFFKKYKAIYQKFVDDIVNSPSKLALFKENTQDKQEKSARDFVKKMMGRLIFLYFLQKKGWLGCKTKWKEGDEQFMKRFEEKAKSNDSFYHQFLEPLFFDTLNARRAKQDEDCVIQKQNFGKVPYLNGGLFEKDENHPVGLTLKSEIFSELFETLNNYNFTIIEDDPEFKEVAVDPEMLGHIFENLLEDNRDKTGTFYTPKEIVHYMCQESLCEYLKTNLQKNNHWPTDESDINQLEASLQRFVKQKLASGIIDYDKPLAKALKEVRICDPAIGSGAFPMGLLNEIYHCVHKLHDESPDKVGDVWGIGKTWQGNKVKLNIIQNSIYGVDIEKGAVDIARLRFWLSLIVDEPEPTPLPNLDYKIMQGNSLLESFEGIDLKFDRKKYAKPIEKAKDLFGNIAEKDKQISIAEAMATSNFDLAKMERDYFETENPAEKEKIRKKITDFEKQFIDKQIAEREKDLHEKINTLSKKLNSNRYETASQKRTDEKLMQQCEKDLVIVEHAKANAIKIKEGNKPYFLWSLYFLNVLDEGGFDIVIGNPPYVQLQGNGGALAKMYENEKFETFERTGDIYSLFYEKGWQLLKSKGVLCFITSNKWMRAGYGETTRKFFADHTNPILLIDFAGQKIFESATVDVNILIFTRDKNQQRTYSCVVKENVLNNLSVFIRQNTSVVGFNSSNSWVILSPIEQTIKSKIEAIGTPLKDWDINIYRGILTGYNEAFILDRNTKDKLIEEDPKSAEIIRPILRGRDIKRYGYDFADLYLITTFPSLKIDIEKFPAVKGHLLSFGYDRLKQTGELGARKKTSNQWFETQDSIGYWDDFSKQKIVWAELARTGNAFTLDDKGYYLGNTGYILVMNKRLEQKMSYEYLLAILNSKAMLFYLDMISTRLDETGWRWLRQYVEQLPIPIVSVEKQDNIRSIVTNELKKKTKAGQDTIDAFVNNIYNLTNEEINFLQRFN